MSHKLQLHLLLDHISAKVTANASYRAMFISQPRLWPIYPFVFENSGYHSQTLISFGGVRIRISMSKNLILHPSFQISVYALMFCIYSKSARDLKMFTCATVASHSLWPLYFWEDTTNNGQILYGEWFCFFFFPWVCCYFLTSDY